MIAYQRLFRAFMPMMNPDDFLHRLPVQLNEQQTEAVKQVNGPVLLLAVPGSGKTTVLIARLGYMIFCMGIAPERILTITYTVAAANDMKNRFASFFGPELAERMEFRTINGLCVKMINYYSRMIGKRPFELISDEKQQNGILTQIYQEIEKEYPAESELKVVRTLITYIKNMQLSEEQIGQLARREDIESGRIDQMYRAYCKKLRERGLMDYDDQMVYAYNILKLSPETLRYFQGTYPYICVDEAQDTSKIQHEIVKLLASKYQNLFMVGDEDQSIYGFRAAYPEALLNFEKTYENARVLLMENNFRSNANIVRAADRFIRNNRLRHAKTMKSARESGSEVKKIEAAGRRAQYKYLLKVAGDCKTQTAVLYRNNESAIPLVDLLERNGIPYRLRKADNSFFTHRTVLDIAAVLKLAEDPTDTESFKRIYFKLNLFLSKSDAAYICRISEKKHQSIPEVAVKEGCFTGRMLTNMKSFRTNLKQLARESGDAAVQRIVKEMGYGEYLRREGLSPGKIFILKTIGERTKSPGELLERLAFLQDVFKNKESDPSCPFILSTIHASKGLEYDSVYLIDIADGIFPESLPEYYPVMTTAEQKIFEEERRLFYVGVTRAKSSLQIFSLPQNSVLLDEYFPHDNSTSVSRIQPKERTSGSIRFFQAPPPQKIAAPKLSDREKKAFIDELGEGVIVEHRVFGKGAVVSCDEENVVVQFESGLKRLNIGMVLEKKLMVIVS